MTKPRTDPPFERVTALLTSETLQTLDQERRRRESTGKRCSAAEVLRHAVEVGVNVQQAIQHEKSATKLLDALDASGWPDLFAAITARGEAGDAQIAMRLVLTGRRLATRFEGTEYFLLQLDRQAQWLLEMGACEPDAAPAGEGGAS